MMDYRGRGEMADVDDILAALKRQPSKVRGGHSPVYLWLWRHHEHLKGELTLPRRTDWSTLAGELGRRGVMDGNGKPPTAERTRKAWWQVGRDKEAVGSRSGPRTTLRPIRSGHYGPAEDPDRPAGEPPRAVPQALSALSSDFHPVFVRPSSVICPAWKAQRSLTDQVIPHRMVVAGCRRTCWVCEAGGVNREHDMSGRHRGVTPPSR